MSASSLLVTGLALLGAGCAVQGKVTRIADGAREDGRYIDASAYSAFARAALLEGAGDVVGALDAYEAARDVDPDSADIATHIGALRCKADPKHPERALAAFEEALALDPTYSGAYAARARCFESRGELGRALEQGLLAVQYDPVPVEQTELVARLLFSLGRKAEAWIWLEALVSLQPSSLKAWQVFHGFAELDGDAVRLRRARLAESALGLLPTEPAQGGVDTLDALLLARDLDGARRAAVSRRWKPSTLALRALEVGVYDIALEQGRSVLLADPGETDAWIAVLVAAEQLHDEAAFRAVLGALEPEMLRPSPRGAALLAALLARRVSEDAGRALREAFARPAE